MLQYTLFTEFNGLLFPIIQKNWKDNHSCFVIHGPVNIRSFGKEHYLSGSGRRNVDLEIINKVCELIQLNPL